MILSTERMNRPGCHRASRNGGRAFFFLLLVSLSYFFLWSQDATLYANAKGCCKKSCGGSRNPTPAASAAAPAAEGQGGGGPPPIGVIVPIKLGYKSYFIFSDIYTKLYNLMKSAVGKRLGRLFRGSDQPTAARVSSHWLHALLLQLTGAVQPESVTKSGKALEGTELNGASLHDLAEKFEVISLNVWKSSGPKTGSPVCAVGDRDCRSRVEEVLYTVLTLFYSTVLSTHGSGVLLKNFKTILQLDECPFAVYSDPAFVNAADEEGSVNVSAVETRLVKLGAGKYTSESCRRFRTTLLTEMNNAGVTVEEEINKLKAEKEGKSGYSLSDLVRSSYASARSSPSFNQMTLLAAVRGEAAALGMEHSSCGERRDAVAAAMSAAKETMTPVVFTQFLEKTEKELRSSGNLCDTMAEAIAVEKKRLDEKQPESEKEDCCCDKKA
ncbi:putative transmembrane protein [Toxoplasma gondii RUB]|uniref:Transmembrane protein n=8 Tax=Toxoplasma gondii TaxID=5811 RepID=S7UVX0_TOXGG|nr:hypothetical protein TGGT1_203600 [Toxoplasma gondii GT1]KAF4642815.1 hypothetical protein TGRH88_035420 [Toxoplasma gondii]KFG37883.1 putative transmembrane protein [Toxoplasma gondii GAB2-2007-GAL-DOM2]KFG39360.1 putative transmembrane protein [Toxoplasma gondii FOU]KFG61842.1 putative transmembrane protein [Toxoplasma gondii RUB]KFH07214.1 putative transmembrane protein [Toxoplasma gondii VAND]KFH09026.1 putative transmembrane protein [Toxoplasma gondii MAS]PUA89358.1 putative transmem